MHSFDDLIETVKQAEQQVRVGCVYAHYRNSEQCYKVLAIAVNEATEEPCVVYQALYGDGLLWVRNASVWCDPVEYEGKIMTRFICQE